jgi:signal transduction histidine kinase
MLRRPFLNLLWLAAALPAVCANADAQTLDHFDQAQRIDPNGQASTTMLPDNQRLDPSRAGPLERTYRWHFDLADTHFDRALYFPGLRAYSRLVVNGHTVFDNRSSLAADLPRGSDAPLLVPVYRDHWRLGRNVVELQALGSTALSVSALEVGATGILAERRRLRVLGTVVGPALVAAVIATLGVSMIFLWSRRREPIYGFFGVGMLGWALHTVWSLSPTRLMPALHYVVWWHALYAFFVAMLVLFSVRFAEANWPRLERAVWLMIPATPVALYAALLLAPGSNFPAYWRLLLIAVVGVGVAAIVRAARRAPSGDRMLIALIGLVSLGAAGYDWWIAQQGRDNNPIYLVPYVGLLFGAFVMKVLIDRFLSASRQIEVMNVDLERRVAEQNVELREALAQMRLARDAAEAADQAKTRFLAAASHDLRQPAHALGLYVASLRGQALTPPQAELAARIASSLEALDSMFSALLDISRIDAGAVTPRSEPFSLVPLLRRLAEEYAPQAEASGLRLVLRVAPGQPATRGDPVLLERIVRNLLANAFKYTDRGGVLLACRSRTDAHGNHRWCIEVWDSGHGIDADERERVFEEYYQLGNPGRDRRQGLGLGLAIVRRLARLMGLEVSLRSRPGRGSLFRLEGLHAFDGAAAESGVAAQAGLRPLHGSTVAVIEDDLDVRDAMRTLLGQWGCHVVEGDDAQDVLRQLPGRAADALIADVRLARGRDGRHEVRLLQSQWQAAVPALIVSGETAPQRVQALDGAELSWLAKPVTADRLHAWLVRVLPPRAQAHRGA